VRCACGANKKDFKRHSHPISGYAKGGMIRPMARLCIAALLGAVIILTWIVLFLASCVMMYTIAFALSQTFEKLLKLARQLFRFANQFDYLAALAVRFEPERASLLHLHSATVLRPFDMNISVAIYRRLRR
jgi:hypothetical protein